MTFREKLQQEHPDKINPKHSGGCQGCPSMYGYEKSDKYYCNDMVDCNDCWDRIIPGTENDENSSNSDASKLARYQKIGTVEECMKAVARRTPKRPFAAKMNHGPDKGRVLPYCPICGNSLWKKANDEFALDTPICTNIRLFGKNGLQRELCGQVINWREWRWDLKDDLDYNINGLTKTVTKLTDGEYEVIKEIDTCTESNERLRIASHTRIIIDGDRGFAAGNVWLKKKDLEPVVNHLKKIR